MAEFDDGGDPLQLGGVKFSLTVFKPEDKAGGNFADDPVLFPALPLLQPPGNLLDSGMEPGSLALQADSLPSEPSGKPRG